MRPKQSERLEEIQKKYLDLKNDENLDEVIVKETIIIYIFNYLFFTYNIIPIYLTIHLILLIQY